MDFGSLRELVRDLNFIVHGLDAVITRPAPDDEPITTRIIWLTPAPDLNPIGLDDQRFQPNFQRRDPIRMLALPRGDVPTAPRGTLIVAKEWGSTTDSTWRVDGSVEHHPDHVKVAVVMVDDET